MHRAITQGRGGAAESESREDQLGRWTLGHDGCGENSLVVYLGTLCLHRRRRRAVLELLHALLVKAANHTGITHLCSKINATVPLASMLVINIDMMGPSMLLRRMQWCHTTTKPSYGMIPDP
mmetsp:Transcript_50321/g.100369  ORF Transcript_50321/g.100369 Transcript_50321/m.100369 type:complete len:122 (+) Transcript_50321:777-1142(+)